MGPYERFAWREARPSIWQREIDEPEQFYAAIAKLYEGSGRMFFAITGHISLVISMTEDQSRVDTERRLENALRQGWLRLRYEQPTIASRVDYDAASSSFKKKYWACSDPVEQAAWIDTTLKTISTGQTGNEWCNSDPPAPKIPTLFVITPPSSTDNRDRTLHRDLVLRAPHDTIDGIGTLHLLNRLITHTSTAYSEALPLRTLICDGSESANLSPPFRVAAAIRPTPTPIQQARLQDIAAGKTVRTRDGIEIEEIGIPYKQGAVVPGIHQRVDHTFSEEQTKTLLAACKASNATVTHAFHAGIAITLRDVQERKASSRPCRYSTYLLRNEREHCMAPYNTAMHAAAVYHSASSGSLAVDLTIPSVADEDADGASKRKEFMEILYIMRDFYHRSRDDPDHPELAPYLWANSVPALPEETIRSGKPLPVPSPNPLPSVSISSMGRIDKIIAPSLGAFEIYNPWVTGEELRNGFGLFLGTFRGHLCLSAAFNDAWHNEDEAVSFLQHCKEVVLQGLDINF
jgi:hypothetical protein